MRPRSKKHFDERYSRVSPLLAAEPETLQGRWLETFPSPDTGKSRERLCLEIGCGKGAFISGMSEAHPDDLFVAMEIVPTVILMAMEKIYKDDGSADNGNVRFICGDARQVDRYFGENELDAIFLNFSDPWPRPKHAKNRLTHPAFLEKYKKMLKPGGIIRQKTDDRLLFDYSCERLKECGFEVTVHETAPEDNILTEYEAKFLGQSLPIYRLTAVNVKL